MEHERKFRWANYSSDKCKEYLRNDFSYECAYCKQTEKACGDIGSEFFEVDHFNPQANSTNNSDIHLYNNLFYSCKRCNSEKSDFWSEYLLNPCETDIFKNDKHITEGYDSSKLYKYKEVTNEGKLYIEVFKLNSRHQIKRRQRRKLYENNIKIINDLIDEILHKLLIKKNIPQKEELISQLDGLREDKNLNVTSLLRDENFEIVEKYLSSKGIKNTVIFEEYNMDFKIKIREKTVYCELIIDNTSQDCNDNKIKYIEKDKLKIWFENLNSSFGILFYFCKTNKLYLFNISDNISKEEIDKLNVKYCVRLTSANLI